MQLEIGLLWYFSKATTVQGVSKNLLESGEQYIVVLPLSFVLSGCLTRREIDAARIVLFKSTINWKVMFNDQ